VVDHSTSRPLKKATITQVAKAAGVSAMTVSRALATPEKVKAVTLEKILSVVDELGFIPNQMASTLARSKSKIIGLSVPSLSNQVFIDVVTAVQEFFVPRGYQVVIHTYHYSPLQEFEGIQMFMRLQVDAVILSGVDQSAESTRLLTKSGTSVLQIMDKAETPFNINVGFSQQEAAGDIVMHLIEQGCQRIAFLGARMDPRAQRRMAGYQSACEQAGIWQPKLCVTTHLKSSIRQGSALYQELASRGEAFDAVFCCNDDLALGVIFECARSKIELPASFKLAGFNNLEIAEESVPTLTSLGADRYGMAQRGCELLLTQMENGSRDKVQETWPVTLFQRETTA